MYERDLLDFPRLLETIGNFLRDAELQDPKKRKLRNACRAYMEIVNTLYPYPAKDYRCTGGPSKIPIITSAYRCNRIALVRTKPLSREAK